MVTAVPKQKTMRTGKVRIFIADDHALVRDGVRLLVDAPSGMCVVGEAATGRSTYEGVRIYQPDGVLMDVSMPDGNGIETTHLLQLYWNGVKMKISGKPVETYKTRSMKQLALDSRDDVIRCALQQGWLQHNAL